MAGEIDVLDAVYTDVQTALSNASAVSISSPSEHAGLMQRHDVVETSYPYVGIEYFGGSDQLSMGIGGDQRVVQTYDTDDDGYPNEYDARRRFLLTTSLGVVLDDEDVRTAAKLLEAIDAHFAQYDHEKSPEDIHADIRQFETQGRTNVSRPGDDVVGQRLNYDFEYTNDRRVVVTPIEDVDMEIYDKDTNTVYFDADDWE